MGNRDKLLLLSSGFVISLATANILAVKLVSVGGLTLPAGVIAYPLTFLFSDVIAEVWGKKTARTVVWIGFATNLLMLLLLYVGKVLPPDPLWHNQESYEAILGAVPRIVAASLVAYLIAQHHDVWAFHFWKAKTGSRFLWLRNNASTLVSQGLDTVIFIALAFYAVVPLEMVLNMMWAQYVVKLLFALADTPFCYLLVGWARGHIRNTGSQQGVALNTVENP